MLQHVFHPVPAYSMAGHPDMDYTAYPVGRTHPHCIQDTDQPFGTGLYSGCHIRILQHVGRLCNLPYHPAGLFLHTGAGISVGTSYGSCTQKIP